LPGPLEIRLWPARRIPGMAIAPLPALSL